MHDPRGHFEIQAEFAARTYTPGGEAGSLTTLSSYFWNLDVASSLLDDGARQHSQNLRSTRSASTATMATIGQCGEHVSSIRGFMEISTTMKHWDIMIPRTLVGFTKATALPT